VKSFDWDGDLKLWEKERSKTTPINSINAVFGQLVNYMELNLMVLSNNMHKNVHCFFV
jgi:hypothetical protein